jgi:hypothetical protein
LPQSSLAYRSGITKLIMSNQSSYRSAEGTPSFLGHHTPSTQTPTRDAETSFRSNESVIESAEEAYGKKLFDFVLADAIFCAASGKEFNVSDVKGWELSKFHSLLISLRTYTRQR